MPGIMARTGPSPLPRPAAGNGFARPRLRKLAHYLMGVEQYDNSQSVSCTTNIIPEGKVPVDLLHHNQASLVRTTVTYTSDRHIDISCTEQTIYRSSSDILSQICSRYRTMYCMQLILPGGARTIRAISQMFSVGSVVCRYIDPAQLP